MVNNVPLARKRSQLPGCAIGDGFPFAPVGELVEKLCRPRKRLGRTNFLALLHFYVVHPRKQPDSADNRLLFFCSLLASPLADYPEVRQPLQTHLRGAVISID